MTEPDDAEDMWSDDEDKATDADEDHEGRRISPILIVVGIVAILGVVAILLATRGNDNKDTASKSRTTTTTKSTGKDGTTGTNTKQVARWPGRVQTRPAVFGKTGQPLDREAKAKAGVYIWTDFDGWHLWVVDPSGKEAAKGTVTSTDDIASADLVVKGSGTVDRSGRRLDFDFSGVSAKAAGVVFSPGFYGSTLLVDLGGSDLPVFLGAKMVEVEQPLTITKSLPG